MITHTLEYDVTFHFLFLFFFYEPEKLIEHLYAFVPSFGRLEANLAVLGIFGVRHKAVRNVI